jgi:hypothetical protein
MKMEPEKFPLISWSHWQIFTDVPRTICWDAQRESANHPSVCIEQAWQSLTAAMPASFPNQIFRIAFYFTNPGHDLKGPYSFCQKINWICISISQYHSSNFPQARILLIIF